MTYIYLERKFRAITEKELEAPESLALSAGWGFSVAEGWFELLQYPPEAD
jgi:hypothetical protein